MFNDDRVAITKTIQQMEFETEAARAVITHEYGNWVVNFHHKFSTAISRTISNFGPRISEARFDDLDKAERFAMEILRRSTPFLIELHHNIDSFEKKWSSLKQYAKEITSS